MTEVAQHRSTANWVLNERLAGVSSLLAPKPYSQPESNLKVRPEFLAHIFGRHALAVQEDQNQNHCHDKKTHNLPSLVLTLQLFEVDPRTSPHKHSRSSDNVLIRFVFLTFHRIATTIADKTRKIGGITSRITCFWLTMSNRRLERASMVDMSSAHDIAKK